MRSISLIVLMQKARIQIWLFEQKDLRIEGRIIVSIHFVFGPSLCLLDEIECLAIKLRNYYFTRGEASVRQQYILVYLR